MQPDPASAVQVRDSRPSVSRACRLCDCSPERCSSQERCIQARHIWRFARCDACKAPRGQRQSAVEQMVRMDHAGRHACRNGRETAQALIQDTVICIYTGKSSSRMNASSRLTMKTQTSDSTTRSSSPRSPSPARTFTPSTQTCSMTQKRLQSECGPLYTSYRTHSARNRLRTAVSQQRAYRKLAGSALPLSASSHLQASFA